MPRDPTYFSPVIDKYFLQWIRVDTWASGHPLDLRRFNKFLKALCRYSRRKPCWLSGFAQTVRAAAGHYHPKMAIERLDERIDHFYSVAEAVYHYNQAQPFPDHLVEMRSPLKVRGILNGPITGSDGNERWRTPEDIERILVENFGPDWRKPYRSD